ncbi:MAG: sulfatase [Pirellula sp.]
MHSNRYNLIATFTVLLSWFIETCLYADAFSKEHVDRPNVLLIAVDDLRNDLGALGVPHAKTPHLDTFASTARVFSRHFVHVPTCGASRCALLRGKYPTQLAHLSNAAIRTTQADWGNQSLPTLFRESGYKTLALGKITHHPGGLTGKAWAVGPEELPGAWDRAWVPKGPWETPEAMMHAYANGAARQPGKSPPLQAQDGPDDLYPDAWVAKDAVATLEQLAAQEQPWFFAVGFFKPHLPFAAPTRWHDLHSSGVPILRPDVAMKPSWPSGWHASGEFRGNYGHEGRDPANDPAYAQLVRQAYAGCVSYMDEQVGRVLAAINQLQLQDKTLVVLWSDHGFLLGEHAIWGKHCLYEHAVRSPLLIRYPGMPMPGRISDSIVETVDVMPTLLDLCALPSRTDLHGTSLRPQLLDPSLKTNKPSYSFWNDGVRSVRTQRWRLIVQEKATGDPRVELFDNDSDPDETRNVASDQKDVVRELMVLLSKVPSPK